MQFLYRHIYLYTYLFLTIALASFGFLPFISTVQAQTASSTDSSSQAVSDRQAQLQAQLNQVEADIAAQQTILDGKQKESQSIQRDIEILDAKIQQAKLTIQAENIKIQQLGKDINDKTQTIGTLSDQVDQNQASIAQLIKKTNEIDDISLAEIVLGSQGLSSFFDDLNSINSVKSSLYSVYQQTQSSIQTTQTQKDQLTTQENAEEDARQTIVTEQAQIQSDEKQQQQLLALNQKDQKSYQSVIDEKKAQAAEINSELFALRDSAAIPFGKALQYATFASQKTGVRPAFLLAILTQESNLGQNTGTCYVTNDTTGAGVSSVSGKAFTNVMNPTRDVPVFLSLMSNLMRDPAQTKVSCPFSTGWGGAMGPAQFIPSTWKAYVPQLSSMMNVATPDPWDPQAAFLASAIYLGNLGADAQTYTAERTAALKYYAGSNWNKSANAFYGDQVMAKAASIQTTMIDPLQNL